MTREERNKKVRLEVTDNRLRLHIGSIFVDLNETDYRELVNIFSTPSGAEWADNQKGMRLDKEWLNWLRKERNDFVKTITKYYPHEVAPNNRHEWTDIRVAAENLLIAYDQMRQKLSEQPQQVKEMNMQYHHKLNVHYTGPLTEEQFVIKIMQANNNDATIVVTH